MLSIFIQVLQVIVALGLINVWLVRFNKKTPYRGNEANSLKKEFKEYGLPVWFFYLIGFLKLGSAAALLLGFLFPALILPAAVLVVFLMLGALSMHLKVKDPLMRSLPAFLMLLMSSAICVVSSPLL